MRNWRIGTHSTSVRTLVTIVGTFVVLSCWHDVELVPIDKGKERELFPVKEFLDDHTRTRVPKFIVQKHLVSGFDGLLNRLRNDDTFPKS